LDGCNSETIQEQTGLDSGKNFLASEAGGSICAQRRSFGGKAAVKKYRLSASADN